MITYSIIQKSQLEGAHRLDAEYYQPEYLILNSKLKTQNSKFLEEIGKVVYGTTPQGGIFEKSGIPFVRSQNFSNLLINTSDLVFCTKEFHQQNKKSAIRPGDILFAVVGATIGEVAIVQDEIEEGNINQNIARVRITDERINPYFLGFFFISRPGQLQIERLITGNAQPYLNSEQINSFIIPIFSDDKQKEIADYFQGIQKQIKISQNLYSQAEELLLEELGLKDFEIKDDLSYIVNLSEVKFAHRADAEYFQPKYDRLIEKIKNQNAKMLSEIFSIRRGDFINPDYYVEKAKRGYIRIKELPVKGDINLDVITYIDDNFLGQNLETLQESDFVFAGIGATLGKTARVLKELEGSFYSNNTARFRLKNQWRDKINIYYLQILLQSMICQWQFKQREAQTAQAKIADEELKTILIPILPKPTQQKIAELVQKSHESRKRAKQLLEEAKQKVEKLIEN